MKSKSSNRARSVPWGLMSPGPDDTRTREGRKLKAALMMGGGGSTMETCFFSVILSFEEDFKKYSRKKKSTAELL